MQFVRYFCLSAALGLVACAQVPSAPQPPAIGLPNPASVYCEQQGGKVDLPTGKCHLPGGTQLDEWDLYYKDHPRTPAKP